MKIGIITFHWATNYGAILQAFCLQEYLKEKDHDVEIINYKPRQFDFSWLYLMLHPMQWLSIGKILNQRLKENMLASFRNNYLNQTRRFLLCSEIVDEAKKYDILISGSDQILNPFFTLHGEKNNPSSAYYLLFASSHTKKIGYAVSFGHTIYPTKALGIASQWINNFDTISVRENTGLNVLSQMKYTGFKDVVPDPTILYGKKLFHKLNISIPNKKESHICVYMLRYNINLSGNYTYIDEKHQPLSMERWLSTIASASGLLTNSYHGMIMAILSHVPFAILLEKGNNKGMNDRFETLLKKLNLESRMCIDVNDALNILNMPIDFSLVDELLYKYQNVGENYLTRNI